MTKIYIVKVQDWFGDYINHSFHRTEAGAKAKIGDANSRYATNSAYVDDADVEE